MREGHIPLYLNPSAGRGRASRLAQTIAALFAEQNVAIDIYRSVAAGNIEQQVFRAASGGAKDILIAGGDGSVHEAVNGILSAGTDTAFGVIPVGTGNDFAKSISTPRDWKLAALELATRLRNKTPQRKIDAGMMNNRFFANGAGIGFDAKVNNIAKKYRWPKGRLVYLLAVLEGLLDGITTPPVKLTYSDGNADAAYTGQIVLASVSNGPWIGGMFQIAPMASNLDGRCDLVFAESMSRGRLARLLPSLIRGRHIGRSGIRHANVTEFSLTALAPLPSHLDGESQPLQSSFTIRSLPGALTLI